MRSSLQSEVLLAWLKWQLEENRQRLADVNGGDAPTKVQQAFGDGISGALEMVICHVQENK